MKNFVFCIFAFVISLNLNVSAVTPVIVDENTGVSSTLDPTIPEPMVFDLVRPLGAKKGETELNILGVYKLDSKHFETSWGPEIEFVIENGYAVEFELPFHNQELDELKFAFQGTISRELDKKFIHGYQTLQKLRFDDYAWEMDYLYIYGYKFNRRWSSIAFSGMRQNIFGNDNSSSVIQNLSVFRSMGKHFKLGLESNFKFASIFSSEERMVDFLLMPQAHFELGKHYSLQVAAGVAREEQSFRPNFGLRFILEI